MSLLLRSLATTVEGERRKSKGGMVEDDGEREGVREREGQCSLERGSVWGYKPLYPYG